MITKRKLYKELKEVQSENERLQFEVSVLQTMYKNLFEQYISVAAPAESKD